MWKCTFCNDIKNIYIENFCYICQNLIYKPYDDVVNYVKEKITENYLKAYNEIPQSFFQQNDFQMLK